MKLSLSNFAWDNYDTELVFTELKKIGINSIEGVLTKLNDWDNLTTDEILNYKNLLDSYGISIMSLQSLFYNVKCDSILDEINFINHFKKLIEFSKLLSINVLVFGSPSLRKKREGWEKSISKTFKQLDSLLEGTGVQISIEPNAKVYGGEYFFNLLEIIDFITSNNLKNIKTMIDTHNIILEGQDPINQFKTYHDKINHIHISENKLSPIKDLIFHSKFSSVLKEIKYDGIITYEVMKCENIMDSVKKFYEIYK